MRWIDLGGEGGRDKEENQIVKKVERPSQGKGEIHPTLRQPQKLIKYTKVINKDTIADGRW